jgi:pimeloyl-ACP methyl ester carboxylesterase
MTHIEASSAFYGQGDFPIYADRLRPAGKGSAPRVLLIHGACNTGTCFLVTPDGRPGWAHDFAAAGFDTYIVDWPGHGRSPMRRHILSLSMTNVRDALARMLFQIGPSVLIAHSAGGPIAWSLAEMLPDHVLGVVGVSPGPPANLVDELVPEAGALKAAASNPDVGLPLFAAEDDFFWADQDFVQQSWFSGAQAPVDAASLFYRSVVPESPRVINERFNISSQGLSVSDLSSVGQRPILIVTGDSDPRHPRKLDQRTASALGAQFVWLGDRAITGNGHMLMVDRNSRIISALIVDWLQSVGLASRGR